MPDSGLRVRATTLRPSIDSRAGGQPDLCVIEGRRRIWIEAIAPDEGGSGPDRVQREGEVVHQLEESSRAPTPHPLDRSYRA